MSKTITLAELDLLKRIMEMTFSTQDGEALAAVRKANKILQKYSLTWAEILTRTVTVAAVPAYEQTYRPSGMTPPSDTEVEEEKNSAKLEDQIRWAFDQLRGNVGESFRPFIASLEAQFERTKYLSPAQRKPLFEAVRRLKERRRRDE